MKTKLFFLGLLSFFYVNSQVIRLVELPAPDLGLSKALSAILTHSGTTKMELAPTNDDCSDAIVLTVSTDTACTVITSATLEGATNSGLPAFAGQADDDVWFSFTASNSTHSISVSNIEASSWQGEDLAMEIRSGECGSLVLVEFSDPNSFIASGLTPGTVYYVRVYSYYDYVVDTTFDICIATPPAAPANDECSAAVPLTVSATEECTTLTSGTLQSATNSGLESEIGEADDDVWYSFTASAASLVVSITDVEGNETDLAFEVVEGACDATLDIIKSSDYDMGLVTGLTVGTTYYLRVYSYGEETDADTVFKVCIATAGQAPINDECDAAIALTVNPDFECGVVTAGTLLYATDSGVAEDTGNADDDVWFSFTATSSIHKISAINIEGNTEDLVIEVFGGECGSTLIQSSDPQSFYITGLNPETVYYIRVFSYSNMLADVTFDLCIGTLAPPPANDECDGAVALTMNPDNACTFVTSSSLNGATDSGFESETGEADDDVWFSFTATTSSHKISLLDVDASEWQGYEVAMEVMGGECGGFTILEGTTSSDLVLGDLTPETVYYVRVYSADDNIVDTTFDICVSTTPDPPANDECSGAVALTVNATQACTATTTGTLQSATNSGIVAETGNADDDVWYSFVATSTSHLITFSNITGNQTDLVFEVLEGECDALSIIKSSDNDMGLATELTVGTTYYLRVFTYGEDNNADTQFKVCVATAGAAPANDDCDAAVVLTVNPDYNCAFTTAGTLAFATDSGIEAESGTADDDVWYSFTATSDTHKISLMNIFGNVTYLAIEVFEGDCGGTIFASDDEPVLIVDNLIEGTVYYVRVYSYNEELALTTFDICVGAMPLSQPNDECEGAIALTVNTDGNCTIVTTASLASATDSGIEAENGEADDDVWFSFVALGTSQKVTITDADDFEDLIIEVFDGTCGGTLTVINEEDSVYVNGLTTGNTYYVRVFSYYSDPVTTTFDLCVALRPAPPANDDCAGAISLNVDAAYCNGVLNNGSNLGATDSGIEIAECFNYGENDVWFSFTVPANVATVDISTDFTGGSLVDTEIALYSGACGNLTELDCDQDSGLTNLINGESYNSIITDTPVTAGATYYVRVSGYSEDSEGSFCLEISTNEVLSTEDFTRNTLKAYPNPVKNILNLSNTTAIADVMIFNLLGQQVVTKAVNANEGQIDMSHLSAGAYLVKVTADNAVQTIKIIKE